MSGWCRERFSAAFFTRLSESAAGQREFLRRCCREPIPVQTEDYVGDTINAAKALIHDNYYLRL